MDSEVGAAFFWRRSFISLHRGKEAKGRYKRSMENRTEPKTLRQWIRYVVVAVIAIWLVIWMLRLSGINVL